MQNHARRTPMFQLLLILLMVFLVGCPHPLTVGLPSESSRPTLYGMLLGEGGYTTQATSLAEIASGATVSLIDPADGGTIATSLTQPDGTFALTFGAWKPTSDVPYLLEAVKGLSIGGEPNRPSANVARLRTLVMHSGGSWKSLTRMADGSDVVRINQSTTALCVISGLKSLSAPQLLDLEHRVVITAGQPDAFIPTPEIAAGEYVSVWALVDASLGFNQDPVRVVALNTETGLYSRLERGPLVTDLSTLKAEPGTQLVLYGNGFDLTAANNKVFFNGSTVPAPGVSVNATGTQLTLPVPADAGFGAIVVQVGKIRCLVAGGSVFKPGTVLEVFAGFKEIPSDVSATSYPLKLRFGSAYYEKPWLVEANGDVVFPADNLTRNLSSGTLEQLVLSGDGRLRPANMSVRTTIIPYVEGSRFGDIGPSESDTLTRDAQGNLFVAAQNCLYMVPVVSGNYYGKAMTAGCIYAVAGNRATNGPTGEVNVPAISTRVRIGISGAGQIAVDAQGNLFFADNEGTAKRLRMVPRANGTYYDQVMTANRIYTLAETASWAVYNVGVDTTGSVYYTALNGLSINVCKVAPDGSLSATYAGEANSSFYHSFAMTGNGTCYVNGGGQLWRIAGGIKTTILAGNTGNSPDGTPLASAKTSAWLKLKATPEGHLYLMDHHNGCVRMIPATSGTYHGKAMLADHLYIVAGFQDVMTVDGVPRKRPLLPNVSGMQVDAQGTVYLASNKDSNPSHSQISIIPAVSGTYFGKAMTAGHHYIIHNLAYPEQLIGSKSIAPLSNGELYVATYSRKIYKIAMDGSVNLILSLTFYPWDIAVDAQDNLYIAGDGKVEILPAINGTYFGQAMTAGTRYTVPGSNALGRPWSVTLDALGNLYTQERVVSNNTQVRMIPNIAGTYFGQAMTVGNLYLLCTTATNYGTSSTVAEGLTLDAAGNLYVSSSRTTGTTSVTKFSAADGQSSHFAGGGTLGDGIPARQARLWPIESLAFGPGGALYLTQPNGVMRIH